MAKAEKILVIDDDPTVCEVVAGLARTMGIECTAAKDPAAFPDLVTRDTALIVLDLMMPGMDGIEVLRLLGQKRSTARILLMSGLDKRVLETAERLAQSLGLWVVGRLQKPCSLYELKEALETLAVIHQPDLNAEIPVLSVSDREMRDAIEHKQLINYYQPQICLKTGRVTGVEALARWVHPTRGIILPEHFLGRLEALGLMGQLGWNAADLALGEAGKIRDSEGQFLRISLNVDIDSLQDLELPERLVSLAHKHKFPADKIVLEVTETGLVEKSHTLDVLTRLRMKGFQLSIDDFGVGYAMMRQVQNVPATELKIDRSIVEKMHVNLSDRVMAEKIIEMAHELGMSVIAEGVAVLQQLELLRHGGCDQVQGFLFSRPLPAADLGPWIRAFEERHEPAVR